MRQQNQLGAAGSQNLLQSQRISIRRIFVEQFMLNKQNFLKLVRSQLFRKRRNALTNRNRGQSSASLLSNLLRRRQSLKASLIPGPPALFSNKQNFHSRLSRPPLQNPRFKSQLLDQLRRNFLGRS